MNTQVIFDMPFEEYLAIEALSSSAIKTINVSISDYIEEKKEDTSTQAKDLGRAYHKRILEGQSAFCDAYTVKKDKSDFLDTVSDIKSFIKDNGASFDSKCLKPELCDIARHLGGDLYIDYLENETREFLSRDQHDRINIFGDYLDKQIGDFKTEVTVLWNIDGVPCKARFDAVNKQGILDLKTFTNPNKISLDQLPAKIIANYRYDIQAVFYCEAYKAASKVNDLFASDAPSFEFLFIQSQGGYNIMRSIFEPHSHSLYSENAYWQKALDDISSAVVEYDGYINGDKKHQFVTVCDWLEDHHLPSYHFIK